MLWLAHIPVQVGVETNLTCVVDQKLLCVRIGYWYPRPYWFKCTALKTQ